MDIAAISTALSQGKVAQQASISVLKMAMGTAEQGANSLTEVLEQSTKQMELSVNSDIGSNIDVSV